MHSKKNIEEPLLLNQNRSGELVEDTDKKSKVGESQDMNLRGDCIFISDIYEEPFETYQCQSALQKNKVKTTAPKEKEEVRDTKIRVFTHMTEEMKKMKNAVSANKLYMEYCNKFSAQFLNSWKIQKDLNSIFLTNDCDLSLTVSQNALQVLNLKSEMFELPVLQNQVTKRQSSTRNWFGAKSNAVQSKETVFSDEQSVEGQDARSNANNAQQHHVISQYSKTFFQYLYVESKFKMMTTQVSETKSCDEHAHGSKEASRNIKVFDSKRNSQDENDSVSTQFIVKNIKFFDREKLYATVLTEMINCKEMDFIKYTEDKDSYVANVSTLQWKPSDKKQTDHFLYFFQRHYAKDKKAGGEEYCKLQLMRLDLILLFQKNGMVAIDEVEDYYIIEHSGNFRNLLFITSIGQKNEKEPEYIREEDFLDNQFVLLQSYNQNRTIEISSLKDIKVANRIEQIDENPTPSFNNRTRNTFQGKQNTFSIVAREQVKDMVFSAFRLQETIKVKDYSQNTLVDQPRITFLTLSQKQIQDFHYQLNSIDEQGLRLTRLEDTFEYKFTKKNMEANDLKKSSTRRSVYVKGTEETQVQAVLISNPVIPLTIESVQLKLTGSEKQETTYYFFIDDKNSIVPVYPLPSEKVIYIRLIELIYKEFDIPPQDKDSELRSTVYHQYKSKPIQAYMEMTTDQLVKTINLDEDSITQITKEYAPHTFFLASDSKEQILTLLMPSSKSLPISIWSLKQPKDFDNHLIQKFEGKNHGLYVNDFEFKFCQEIKDLKFKTKQQSLRGRQQDSCEKNHQFQRGAFVPSLLHLTCKNLKVGNFFEKTHEHKNSSIYFSQVTILDSNKDFKTINVFDKREFLKEFDTTLVNKKVKNIEPIRGGASSPRRNRSPSRTDSPRNQKERSPVRRTTTNVKEENKELNELGLEITMEYYSVFVKSKEDHYFFVFSFAFNYQGFKIKSYFIVIKSLNFMNQMFNGEQVLFKFTDQMLFICDKQRFIERDFASIRQQMKDLYLGSNSEIEGEAYRKKGDYKLQNIKLIFPKAHDDRTKPNFVAFVCQTKVDKLKRERSFVVLDILNKKFHVQDILMRFKNQELVSKDNEGFENIMLCQTSDYVTTEQASEYSQFCQAKFSMLAVFQQEVGMIKIRDFIVTQKTNKAKNNLETFIQLMGMKHIFFSNDFIKKVNYDLLANHSFVVPLYHEQNIKRKKKKNNIIQFVRKSENKVIKKGADDESDQEMMILGGNASSGEKCRQIDGLKLILFTKEVSDDQESNHILLNFPETINNVLYTCRTSLVLMGSLHQQLTDLESEYCQIITQRISWKALTKSQSDPKFGEPLLNNNEALYVLEKFSKKQLSLQMPDLKYVFLNSYEDLLSQNFFQSQELLEGKSLCDIAINDYQIVCDNCALALQKKSKVETNTLLNKICENDSYRKKMFQQIEFVDKVFLLNFDFDFKGTINRAIDCGAEQSIKVIFQTIFEQGENPQFYYDMIMFELVEMMKSRNLDLDFFFSRFSSEDTMDGFTCCFERQLSDFNLPQYSLKEDQVQILQSANIFDEVREQELNSRVIEQEKQNQLLNPSKMATNKVEHCYINLAIIQLAAKINVEEDEEIQGFIEDFKEMNHLALSKMIAIKSESKDLNFFKLQPVQRIIQLQWNSAKNVLFFQFFIFFTLYFMPLIFLILQHRNYRDLMWELQNKKGGEEYYRVDKRSVWESMKSVFEGHSAVSNELLKLCLMTRILFFINELFQIRDNKWAYFQSIWNWIDISEFFGFIVYSMSLYGYIKSTADYLPEILYCVIVLAFLKFMFFVRMSETLGFITNMIFNCLLALIPFTITFLFFLLLFTLLLTVLNNDIDREVVEGAEFLPHFQQAILQTFRTSIGELGLPQYAEINSQPDSFRKYLNIYMIWGTWYTQCFFNLVVMLNFIIAVINSAYEEIKEKQQMINYRNKAQLNLEVFELQKNIMNLEPFTVVLFSQLKKENEEVNDPNQIRFDNVKKMFMKQSKEQEAYNTKVKNSLTDIQIRQQELLQQFKQKMPAVPQAQALSPREERRGSTPMKKIEQKDEISSAFKQIKEVKKQLSEEISQLKRQQQKALPRTEGLFNEDKDSVDDLNKKIKSQNSEIQQLKALLKETDSTLQKEISKNQLQIFKLMDRVQQIERQDGGTASPIRLTKQERQSMKEGREEQKTAVELLSEVKQKYYTMVSEEVSQNEEELDKSSKAQTSRNNVTGVSPLASSKNKSEALFKRSRKPTGQGKQ